jgi:hypothetical protein
MFDDRDDVPGDLVDGSNEEEWRRKFCSDTGHTMECVTETVDAMASLMSKVCSAHGAPVDKILELMTVEQFGVALQKILRSKGCGCND